MDGTRPSTHELARQVDMLRPSVGDDLTGTAQWDRTSAILDRFERFATLAHDVGQLAEVTSDVARSFIEARTNAGEQPSVATMHWRRTALRLLFKAARHEGMVEGDPTIDVSLPPRSSLAARPLTVDEIALCRGCALWSLSSARRAAVWALAEATCRTSELPHIRVDDLDLDAGEVSIHGGKSTQPRVGQLSEWGVKQLGRRIDELGDPTAPLVYRGQSPTGAGQVAGAAAVIDVLTRAGLHSEPDVRPGSVAAWAGVQVLKETGRIEAVAQALGVRSLDQAARIIGWDWKQVEPG